MQIMAKRLSAITGEYNDKQTGQQKAEWTNIGVILQSQNGKDYMLLDPSVSLPGVLAKQNALAMRKGEQVRDNVMVSLIDENQNQQQGGFNQQPQQGFNNQQQQQGGFNQQQSQQGFNNQQNQQQNQGGFASNNQVNQQANPNDPPF